jgi:translation initiation factor 2 beta subunit (eIF-2beta)/eIF-5|tara:strand:- start:403 stop:669 length:267 start_codon:yes stop_codon:yes gene_type:complete
MKIKALGKQFQVKDISYKQRRDLHRLNAKAFWDGKVDPESYYDVLEKVAEISGLTEKDFKSLSMVEVDQVLQEVFTEYIGLEKNVDGD